jgi:hypothetical protein
VQVVEVHPVLDGLHPQLFGGAVDESSLDTTASQIEKPRLWWSRLFAPLE